MFPEIRGNVENVSHTYNELTRTISHLNYYNVNSISPNKVTLFLYKIENSSKKGFTLLTDKVHNCGVVTVYRQNMCEIMTVESNCYVIITPQDPKVTILTYEYCIE